MQYLRHCTYASLILLAEQYNFIEHACIMTDFVKDFQRQRIVTQMRNPIIGDGEPIVKELIRTVECYVHHFTIVNNAQ